jgi:hypothetical protein
MRGLFLAAALAVAATPALAKAPVVDPDPMTVSGRFELPHATRYAGRVRLGEVTVHPGFVNPTALDAVALKAAATEAAKRSLKNFGYLAETDPADAVTLDIEVLPLEIAPADGASQVTARIEARSSDACLAHAAEGRFTVLDRQRSGGGRRAFALGAAVALAFVGVNAGGLVGTELEQASAENHTRNAGRLVATGQGVAPGFTPAAVASYGGQSALRLALADYLRQLGDTPACRPADDAEKLAAS